VNTPKEKSVRRVRFREANEPRPLRYSIVWQSHLLVLSPVQLKIFTGQQFLVHLGDSIVEWKGRDVPLRGVLVDMGVSEEDQIALCEELFFKRLTFFAPKRTKKEHKRKKRVQKFCCRFNDEYASFIGFDPGHMRPGIREGVHPHPGPRVVCLGPQGTHVVTVAITETEFTIRAFLYAKLHGRIPYSEIRFTTVDAVIIGEDEPLTAFFRNGLLLLNYYDMREVMAAAV